MQVNESKQLRDIAIIGDMERRAELGGFEKEFHMYGTAYLQNDTLYYRVSSDRCYIYQTQAELELKHIYCASTLAHSTRCFTSPDTVDDISYAVKIELAKKLQQNYSPSLFQWLHQLAEQAREDYAFPMLEAIKQQLQGRFQEDKLKQFRQLVEYCYRILALNTLHYTELIHWLEEEYKYMGDVYIRKEAHQKTYYGIAYWKNGKIFYEEDALLSYIVRKTEELEAQGILTTPVYEKTIYYTYTKNLLDVRREFLEALHLIFDTKYMNILLELSTKRNQSIDSQWLQNELLVLEEKYSETAMHTIKGYLNKWRLL